MIEIIMGAKKVTNANRTFIYFVRSGEFIKIGQSRTWKTRVMNMQVGASYENSPWTTSWISKPRAARKETLT